MELRAKRNVVLENLKKELAKGFLEKEVMVRGHKWLLHTLNEEEETWSDTFVNTASPAALLGSRKSPRLAASIKAMDGVPVDSLFLYPDDMPKEVQKALNEDEVRKRFWIRDQLLLFLNEDSHRVFIEELYSKFMELENDRNEAIKEVPKS